MMGCVGLPGGSRWPSMRIALDVAHSSLPSEVRRPIGGSLSSSFSDILTIFRNWVKRSPSLRRRKLITTSKTKNCGERIRNEKRSMVSSLNQGATAAAWRPFLPCWCPPGSHSQLLPAWLGFLTHPQSALPHHQPLSINKAHSGGAKVKLN